MILSNIVLSFVYNSYDSLLADNLDEELLELETNKDEVQRADWLDKLNRNQGKGMTYKTYKKDKQKAAGNLSLVINMPMGSMK